MFVAWVAQADVLARQGQGPVARVRWPLRPGTGGFVTPIVLAQKALLALHARINTYHLADPGLAKEDYLLS